MNQGIPIKDLPQDVQDSIFKELENPTTGCSRCGCKGLHACMGSPVVWTESDIKRLNLALSKMFGWDQDLPLTGLIKVKQANYHPKNIIVKEQIDCFSFKADFNSKEVENIKQDILVEDIVFNEAVN
jgi:hypothetical protein